MKRTIAALSFAALLAVTAFGQIRVTNSAKGAYCSACCHGQCGESCCKSGCTDSCCQSK